MLWDRGVMDPLTYISEYVGDEVRVETEKFGYVKDLLARLVFKLKLTLHLNKLALYCHPLTCVPLPPLQPAEVIEPIVPIDT